MILQTGGTNERPLFRGYVNAIISKEVRGGTFKQFVVGTSEKKTDKNGNPLQVDDGNGGTKDFYENSSWFCTLIGKARALNERKPIEKGDRINVLGYKITNISNKDQDGNWTPRYLNVSILDFDYIGPKNSAIEQEDDYENDIDIESLY